MQEYCIECISEVILTNIPNICSRGGNKNETRPFLRINLGPVVQSVVSLTISLRVISLTVLADSIYNILIFFAEKM